MNGRICISLHLLGHPPDKSLSKHTVASEEMRYLILECMPFKLQLIERQLSHYHSSIPSWNIFKPDFNWQIILLGLKSLIYYILLWKQRSFQTDYLICQFLFPNLHFSLAPFVTQLVFFLFLGRRCQWKSGLCFSKELAPNGV